MRPAPIIALFEKTRQESFLLRVGILVFVNHDIRETVSYLFRAFFVFFIVHERESEFSIIGEGERIRRSLKVGENGIGLFDHLEQENDIVAVIKDFFALTLFI